MDFREIFERIAQIPAPSGHEDALTAEVRSILEPFCDSIQLDSMGNLIAVKRGGNNASGSFLINVPCDEAGFTVTGYEKNYLKLGLLGKIDVRLMPAQRLKILTDPPLLGSVAVMPVHALKAEDMAKAAGLNQLSVDCGLNEGNVKKIPCGTSVTWHSPIIMSGKGYIGASSATKAAVAACVLAFSEINAIALNMDVFLLLSVQHNFGSRGVQAAAFDLKPDYAVSVEPVSAGINGTAGMPTLGSGPVLPFSPYCSRSWTAQTVQAAQKAAVQIQTGTIIGNTASDVKTLQITAGGRKTVCVQLPALGLAAPNESFFTEDAENLCTVIKMTVASGKENGDC